MLQTKQRRRRYFSDSELDLAWDRWQKGESLNAIACDLDRDHSAVQGAFAKTGGIRPAKRRQIDWIVRLQLYAPFPRANWSTAQSQLPSVWRRAISAVISPLPSRDEVSARSPLHSAGA